MLHFSDWLSIELSGILLKRSLQISLQKKLFTNFETASLLHFLYPSFNVLADAVISVWTAFSLIKSEYRLSSVNGVILQSYYLSMHKSLRLAMIDFKWKKICERFPSFANLKLTSKLWYKWMHISCVNHIFFHQGFLSQTLMTHRTAGERRWPSFIVTNIQTFICNFACEMTITYFWSQRCVYQTATRWDLPIYRVTIWLIDWWCDYLLMWFQAFFTAYLTRGNRWARTCIDILPLFYKQTD